MPILILALIVIAIILAAIICLVVYTLVKSHQTKKPAPLFAYTTGRVMLVNVKGPDEPQVVIMYSVGKNAYQLAEKLQYKTEPIKSGDIIIGHKKVPLMQVEPDQNVIVMYQLKDPALAVWVANHPQKDVTEH